jgi:Pyruvate-formate lyase
MLNTERTVLRPANAERIQGLHDDKMAINDYKLKTIGIGNFDFDDWGFVYYPDFKFQAVGTDKPWGYRYIGTNLRRFLEQMPKYVNRHSALGGAWIKPLTDYMPIGWDPADDAPQELREKWGKYNTYPGFGGMNHCGGDIEIGLELGWGGLLDKVRYYREFNDPADTAFYDCEEDVILGTQAFISGVAAEARRMAAAESDPAYKQNLIEIAEINEWLIYNPPRTLREACQFVAHFQTIDRTYFVGGALDQLDEKLRPYYEQDIADGLIEDDDAVWFIASLFFNDTHYSQIAGLIPDGTRDMTSRMSFIVLDAMHWLKIPINIALRVSDIVNPELLRRSLEYTLEDGTGVSYSLNVGIEEGFARNGYPIQVARRRIKVGCNWCAIPGWEYPLQDVTRCNLGIAFWNALQDVKSSGNLSLDYLFERTCYHTKIIVDSIKEGYDLHYERIGRNRPEVVYNLFMHGCVERGLNCSEGGVDIVNFNIDGVALATVADSFAAIEQRVVNEGRLSWEKLFEVLDANYEGYENERLMLKNINRFGSPDSLAEKWALRLRDFYVDTCKSSGTPKHHLPIIPGLFSHGTIKDLGRNLPATPNGRKSGEVISHSNEPDPGFALGLNTFSPTLKATAVAEAQPGYGNSAPLHLDIDSDMLAKAGGIDALIALIHAHNHMGGTLINLNCLTEKVLREAHENPASHPDLVVRVTGYSAFFASLSKNYRQQIIDRFLAKNG